MTARRPLPQIAPCPRPGCSKWREVRVEDNGYGKDNWWVQCRCGWQGPPRSTKRAAIVIWGIRRSDAEAERRGAMAAADWLGNQHGKGFAVASKWLRMAIERGEVLKQEWILKQYPGLTAEGLAAALAYRLPGKAKKGESNV